MSRQEGDTGTRGDGSGTTDRTAPEECPETVLSAGEERKIGASVFTVAEWLDHSKPVVFYKNDRRGVNRIHPP
jgi:hypothetical protein